MDEKLLRDLGLSPSQARAYLLLITSGSLTPPELTKKTGESRTNAYMVLDRLVELGLATKTEEAKKFRFRPTNPIAIEKLAARRRDETLEVENRVKTEMSKMLSYYYTFQAEPGVRFFQGKDGLKEIYKDHLRTKAEVYFVRTQSDERYFGDLLYDYMRQRARLKMKARGLAPYTRETYKFAKENDQSLRREMSWFPPEAYRSPVEISIYGDKVSFISFGNEAVGTIVDSPQIAEAMRELFRMAQRGARELIKEKKIRLR